MAKPIEITDQNFESEILKSSLPAITDFGAPWCPPCRALEPLIDQFAEEYEGKVVFGKVNVDNCREVAGKYGIMSVPTIIFFKDGQEVDRLVGFSPKDVLKTKIETFAF
ncbi:MAG TPA: thioredoxin [Candidatus Sumerlaeota bacterium]|nr:thioredoxin [Candidatus Sumerlaeota bacterium]